MAGYDGHRGWLYTIAVLQSYRRTGVGTALLRDAEARLLALGCPKINLQVLSGNAPACAFYEQLGYAIEERVSMGKARRQVCAGRLTMNPEIVVLENPDPRIRTAILGLLIAFNESKTGPSGFAPVAMVLEDRSGELIGGLWGRSVYDWLFVEHLFVPEHLRGRGLGTALMRRAEELAIVPRLYRRVPRHVRFQRARILPETRLRGHCRPGKSAARVHAAHLQEVHRAMKTRANRRVSVPDRRR